MTLHMPVSRSNESRLSRRPALTWFQGQVGRSSPQVLEPAWRQFGVSDRALDRSMAEIALKGPGIGAPIGQHESARMAQHVRMHRKRHPGLDSGTLDELGPARGGERRPSLRDEYKGRF